MTELPRAALSRAPLFIISVALSVGLLCARVPNTHPTFLLVLGVALSLALSAVSLLLFRQQKLFAASVCLMTAFLSTGLSLGIADTKTRARNHLSHLYEQGIILTGDPVELTGAIDGPPERAPDRIFLQVRANKISFKQTEYGCSGTVLLTPHIAHHERLRAFNALQLPHA